MKAKAELVIAGRVILLFLLIVSLAPTRSLAASNRPNIIFVLTDDQRLEDFEHMPMAIKLLRANGMSFSNYFANVSLCCPSRTSILRGQYAHNTGVLGNRAPDGGFAVAHSLGLENSTVATWLQASGYQTALIGKYINQYPGDLGATYIPPGWSYWASPVKSAGREYSEYDYTLNENGSLHSYGHTAADYGTDVYAQKANDFIRKSVQTNKPFFLYLAFYAPHSPATPAQRHLNLFKDATIPASKAFNEADVSTKPDYIQALSPMTAEEIKAANSYYGRRLASLQAVDEAIGSICKTLDDAQAMDNTYIVFTSDNGFHLGEHRLRLGKQTAYETDMHLPMIVRGPGISKGSTCDQPVGNIDLAPTFADMAKASVPGFVDGVSLLPLFRGEKKEAWRKEFLVEHWHRTARNGRRNRRALVPQSEAASFAVLRASQSDESLDTAGEWQASGTATSSTTMRLVSHNGQDLAEASEENDEGVGSVPQSGSGPQGRRILPNGVPDPIDYRNEFGNIPTYSAIRSHDDLYVEYVTGEKEFYHLTEDPDEINNICSSPKAQTEASAKHENLARLKSAGKR